MELRIRRPAAGDEGALETLYRSAFGRRGPPGRTLVFQRERAVVAVVGGRVVGFGCYEPAKPDLDPQLAALDPESRRFLDPLRELEDDPAVRVEAPRGLLVARGRGDRVFTALAVDARYRRRGVGRLLAVARLQLALRDGVPQVFVHCIDGSGSRGLYEKLGFVPLVHVTRHYRDGTGMSLLYRALR
jgi:GNAT superfamily N-acetyltransferase